jgi:hypothetical protein
MRRPEFEKVLDEQLQSIETEADRIARIQQIRDQISGLEGQIIELKRQLAHESESLTGDLAIAIRKAMPGLSVSLDGGSCHVRHLANNLDLRPDFQNGLWNVEQNISGRRFRKHHGHVLGLKHDIAPLADGISSFFKQRYKKLNMEDVGPAARVIPNKKGSIMGYK